VAEGSRSLPPVFQIIRKSGNQFLPGCRPILTSLETLPNLTCTEKAFHWHASGMDNGYAGDSCRGQKNVFSMERQMDQRGTLTTNQEPADKLPYE
jgi:hypothetical protein